MKLGGLVDRARSFSRRRQERRELKRLQRAQHELVNDIQRRGREWVAPRRGGEHRPWWKMVPSPGLQRNALRDERRRRRKRLHRKMGKGIAGYPTHSRAGQL